MQLDAVSLASVVVTMVGGYLTVGLAFALWFALRGAARLDPVAEGGSFGFRALIVPGAMMLWPYLIVRLLRNTKRANGM